MPILRAVAALAGLVLLSACATLPRPSLSPTDLAQFHLAGVEVEGGSAFRTWPAQEEAFLGAHQLDQDTINRIKTRPISEDPAMTAFALHAATGLFKADLGNATAGVMSGPKPVKAVVTLKRFDVPSVMRRMLTDQVAALTARVTLVDASGASLLASPEITVTIGLVGGLSSPIASGIESVAGKEPGRELVKAFAVRYRDWLLQK